MTPLQVADRWSCSPRHVRRLCGSGALRSMRLGDALRIALADVLAYEAEHTSEPAPLKVARAEQEVARTLGVSTTANIGPAPENPVFPALWGLPALPAAQPAAGRGRSAAKRRASSVRR